MNDSIDIHLSRTHLKLVLFAIAGLIPVVIGAIFLVVTLALSPGGGDETLSVAQTTVTPSPQTTAPTAAVTPSPIATPQPTLPPTPAPAIQNATPAPATPPPPPPPPPTPAATVDTQAVCDNDALEVGRRVYSLYRAKGYSPTTYEGLSNEAYNVYHGFCVQSNDATVNIYDFCYGVDAKRYFFYSEDAQQWYDDCIARKFY